MKPRLFALVMTRTFVAGSLALAVLAGTGCGETPGTPEDGATETDPDASEVGAACDRWLAALAPEGIYLENVVFTNHRVPPMPAIATFPAADQEAMLATSRKTCLGVATLPGSHLDAAFLDRCREAITAALPVDLTPVEVTWPAACAAPLGGLANQAPCTFNHQCAGGWCSAVTLNCGVCADAGALHAPCDGVARSCAPGLNCIDVAPTLPYTVHDGVPVYQCETTLPDCDGECGAIERCDYASNTCQPPGPVGTRCTYDFHCAGALRCAPNACADAFSYCCADVRALGASCDHSFECAKDAYCALSADGSGVCTAALPDGATCSGSGSDECDFAGTNRYCATRCDGGMVCAARDEVAPGVATTTTEDHCRLDSSYAPLGCGVCPALVADGAPCSDATVCTPQSACVNGVCQFLDVAACK